MPQTDTKATKTKTKASKSKSSKKTKAAKVAFPALTSETRTVRGIRLPWERIERYGPTTYPNGQVSDDPPKGTVLESGEVFIDLDTLYQLAEQDVWDSQFAEALLLGYHEGLALEAAGLAAQETRGGFHRTDLLLAFIKSVESSSESK